MKNEKSAWAGVPGKPVEEPVTGKLLPVLSHRFDCSRAAFTV